MFEVAAMIYYSSHSNKGVRRPNGLLDKMHLM